jgi:hypothetical protein
MKLVVIGMPKAWPWGYVAIYIEVSGDKFELATGRPFTSTGRFCTSTGRPFTRTDQCGENPAYILEQKPPPNKRQSRFEAGGSPAS